MISPTRFAARGSGTYKYYIDSPGCMEYGGIGMCQFLYHILYPEKLIKKEWTLQPRIPNVIYFDHRERSIEAGG